MDFMGFVLLFVAGILLLVAALVFAAPILVLVAAIIVLVVRHFREKKRRRALQDLAARYGLRFSPGDPFNLTRYGFTLFGKGRYGRVRDCLDGRYQNLPLVVFGYSHEGDHGGTQHFSVLLAHLEFSGPRLLIRPEGSLDRLAEFLGRDDIDFEYEAFNRSFHVEGDKKFAYDICHAEMMQFLMGHRGASWELDKDFLLLSIPRDGDLQVVDVERCLGLAIRFVALIPRYLLAEGRT